MIQLDNGNLPAADWYMTFQYRFNFEPRLRAEPALLRDRTTATQLLRLSLDNLRPGRTVHVSDLQADVERKQWHNLDLALELIQNTKSYPPEARYKWNLEVIWALDTYMRQASPQRQQEMLTAIGDGALGVKALYANMLTGLANAEEMSHFVEFARKLRKGIGSALNQSGIKYLAVAPNSGDRIGYVLSTWGDKPFYWVSQSGKEGLSAFSTPGGGSQA